MELPNPRRPCLAPPRPGLVNDFFAPPIRPRALSGKAALVLLHPGSSLTGRPQHDVRPIGRPKLGVPKFLVVELSDGRPGIVAVADLTRVWTNPRYALPHPHPRPPAVASQGWWEEFKEAIRPKAGFILYAPDSVLPNAENPDQFLRHGFIYGAIDVSELKQAMDMAGAGWDSADTVSKWFNRIMNFALGFKDTQSAKSIWDAGKTVYDAATGPPKPEPVRERIVGQPRVKLVVYSGHKTRVTQADSANYAYGASNPYDAMGDGHFVRVEKAGGVYDSAYQARAHLHGQYVGTVVTLPTWRDH